MKASKIVGLVAILTLGLGQVALAQALPSQALEHMPVCAEGPTSSTAARCHARVVVNNHGKPQTTQAPAAYGPRELRAAYNLSGVAATSQIIAIVDAYDHPYIQSDLDTYSTKYGLPALPACTGPVSTSATPCFQKVDQNGGTSYPAANSGWALEIALDVETAHAVCENCSILLVEATSNNLADLFAAVDTAAALGADEISNSYGTSQEFTGENDFDFHFNRPGIAITVSSGDSGYGVSYPAASPYVTAVGGTSLYLNSDNSYNKESAWSGTGSGCSILESVKPAGQPTLSGCANRTVADVSAVADPNTGVAIYNSYPYNGSTGWFKMGGTSLSAPLIAAIYALAGGVADGVQGNTLPYAQALGNMHDITTGSNGNCGTTGRGKNAILP
ncbi:S53 family peptidase, partial [Candidatus Parcubacteria bacterium]|nr:S53 family peptidase [Candidatus Parcubacteria bacterium]